MNRRTKFGLITSGLYVVAFFLYLILVDESRLSLGRLAPNNLGDAIAGLAAPLAFLWLVVGYLQQGEELRLQREQLELQREELRLQREEVRRLADEAAKQAKAIEANELHARRDTFLRISESLFSSMNGFLSSILQQVLSDGIVASTWEHYANGNLDAFARRYFEYLGEIERRNLVTTDGMERFCRTFERLISETQAIDPEGLLTEIFSSGALARLYRRYCNSIGRAPIL